MSRAVLPLRTEWLRAEVRERPIRVDREASIIYGYVVAEEGPFKSEGRGEFDTKAIREIARLMKLNGPHGTKSRFTHPTLSDDGLGKFLGRSRTPGTDKLAGENGNKDRLIVRADLHFDATALETPPAGGRPLGDYVMSLAESDPAALSSSLVLTVDEEIRYDSKGRPLLNEETGEPLPPLWRPKQIHASDIVDTGDAVGALLSADTLDSLPDNVVRQAAALLDRQFGGCNRETVQVRCLNWLTRYLDWRFGPRESLQRESGRVLRIRKRH